MVRPISRPGIARPFLLGISVLFSLVAAQPFLSAQSVGDLLADVPEDLRGRLEATGAVDRYIEDHRDIALLPNHSLVEEIRDLIDDVRPNVISEQAILVDQAPDREQVLELFNSLRRISALSYLEYYNERKDKTDELFYDSVAVSGPEERDRIADPTVARIPARDTVWALQGLPPFGTILSRYDYRSDGESFLFLGTNHDTLTFRSVPVVRQGNMVTAILVVPGDDFILMYGVGAVRAFTMFGLLDDRIEAAFSGRTEGLFDWYSQTYLGKLDDRS